MLALYLLASHLVGDFIFQTRWQASGKFGWTSEAVGLRWRHVATYLLAFVPLVTVRLTAEGGSLGWYARHGLPFMVALAVLHFLTDSRRFTSTVGDVLAWRRLSLEARHRAWNTNLFTGPDPAIIPKDWARWPPPNPWPTLPICIDQALHIVQLAALGWLLT